MKMLEKFREEVKKVEHLERRVERSMMGLQQEAISTMAVLERLDQELIQPGEVTVRQPPAMYRTEACDTPRKLTKTPDLPPFLGMDLVPKDEGSWEQWEFQVKGFLNTHTPEAVWAAIVHSVWGAVEELVGFMGYQVDLGTILTTVEKRFGKIMMGNRL